MDKAVSPALGDGSSELVRELVGPEAWEILEVNKPRRDYPGELRFNIAPFYLRILRFAPKPFRARARELVLASSAGFFAAAVCGAGEELPGIVEPYIVNDENGRDLPYNPNGIFGFPVPISDEIEIQRAYTEVDDEGKQHLGQDYIRGQIDNSKTWETFPVLAVAEGQACLNPKNRQGTAVLVTHNIGGQVYITYSGHLSSYFKKIPECLDEQGNPSGLSVFVSRGQIIGYSGSSGAAKESLNHLHFEVKVPGEGNRDAYDIYSTREDYPSVTGSNGNYCGPKTLFINCEVGSQPSLIQTLEPRATAEAVETVEIPQLPTVVERPDLVQGEGIIDLGNWELRVKSWNEEPAQKHNGDAREGWKKVTITGEVVNTSSQISDAVELGRVSGKYDYNVEAGGSLYEANLSGSGHEGVAPGQSIPVTIYVDVPQNFDTTGLAVAHAGSLLGEVSFGEVWSVEEEILPGVNKSSSDELCVISGYASIGFLGSESRVVESYSDSRGFYSEQFLILNIENNGGDDIRTYIGTRFDLKVYTRDGQAIEGSAVFNSETGKNYETIPPGLEKKVLVQIGDDKNDEFTAHQLVDLSGAVVLLNVEDEDGSVQTCAWQLSD